jgi:phosphoglucosamine mutase
VKERLFGTDGMRGVALRYPLDEATVTRLGHALADHLRERGAACRVLLAGDTRISTTQLAAWLGGAFLGNGGVVEWAGVLPTPAVSHLVRSDGGYGAGVIVSASHNPASDNGIKLVNASGSKWPATEEHSLEHRLTALPTEPTVLALGAPSAADTERYLAILLATLPERALAGLHVVVDAAQGAASPLAGELFARSGARATVLNASPDGLNINAGCGALHPEGLAVAVRELGADAGVALDGDADRAVLVTHTGRVLDGDDVLWLWARELAEEDRLPRRTLVATVMSNLGLELATKRAGLRLERCPVGDREVWETMQRRGAALGGEQSGHVICAHHAVTGDGLLTAAHVLHVARRRGVPLEDLADLEHYPQVLLNVRVAHRRPLQDVPELAAAMAELQASLDGNGRVFVRYSGTEPLLRIMVEAATHEVAQSTADHLATLARQHLGAA